MDLVLIHGFVFQLQRHKQKSYILKRWAYVKSDSLFIFPDHTNRNSCLKIFLRHSDVSISYPDDDTPWITITEHPGAVYYLKPETGNSFQNWLTAIHKASKSYEGYSVNHGQEYEQHYANKRSQASTGQNVLTSIGYQEKRKSNQPDDNYFNTYPINENLRMNDAYDKNIKYANGRSLNQGSQFKFTSDEAKPPPRPPRNPHTLQTVKEHASMRDDEIVETKPLANVKHRYPVTGLAKRMSIAASDLLGKSRDDLILLLLQLNREKANLKRWYEYFTYQIDQIKLIKGNTREARTDIAAIQTELNDVTGQLELSEPLIKFLDNMIRMGDVYAGDDVLFASEYRKHLLPSHEIVPSKPSLEFARDVEEREVARVLNNSMRQVHRSESLSDGTTAAAAGYSSSSGKPVSPLPSITDMDMSDPIIPKLDNMPEPDEIRLQRRQLEKELDNLEKLCAPHQLIHNNLRSTQKAMRQVDKGTKLSSEQPNKFTSKAPSASLLRRLHPDGGYYRQPKSANSSLRRKTFNNTDEYNDDIYDYMYKRPSTGFEHYPQSSFRHLRNNSTHSSHDRDRRHSHRRENYLLDDEGDEDAIKKFQSIPDDLNLLPRDSLFMQSKIKPLQDERHKPLNSSNPTDLINKSSVRSPKTFYNQGILSPTINNNNFKRKSFELPSRYDNHNDGEVVNDRLRRMPFREFSWNEIRNSNEWRYNNNDLSRQKRFNGKFDGDLEDDLREYSNFIQSKQKAFTSQQKSFPSYDSNELNRNIQQRFDHLLEDIDFPSVPGQLDRDVSYEDRLSRRKHNRDQLEENRVYNDARVARSRQPITVVDSYSWKPSSSSLSTRGQYPDTVYANISQSYSGSTLQRSDILTDVNQPVDRSGNRSDYCSVYNSKKDTISSRRSSISEHNRIQPIRRHLLPYTNTDSSKYKSSVGSDSPRHAYQDHENLNSTGSLESVFTTQDPNTIEERWLSTPKSSPRKDVNKSSDNSNSNTNNNNKTPTENEDIVIMLRNKEDKINSLRNVLLRQSLTDSPVYNPKDDRMVDLDQTIEKNTAVAERFRLITVKEQLAKEAAVTVAPLWK
uniref:PH domain-containing protein n=1 Tax=Trichobilharzia regenti TaxID=157069 RepID=A0AA85KF02_TRIRE|nr:unnamed protein product [Trichobilharzia regenti]